VAKAHLAWNYTSVLNIVFLALAVLLVWRFLSTGRSEMLRPGNFADQLSVHGPLQSIAGYALP